MPTSEITLETARIRVGTHIRVRRSGFFHHGIYIGRKKVIHFRGKSKTLATVGPVAKDSLAQFLLGGTELSDARHRAAKANIVKHQNPGTREEILARAKSLLGSSDYSLITNNCEHLASWCVTGSASSAQVSTMIWTGLVGYLINHYILEE